MNSTLENRNRQDEGKVRVVILAGGQGARFWPVSRKQHPKQFLSINPSGESLIQVTLRRTLPLASSEDALIVTNVAHRDLVEKHLPGVRLICEPFARNTAAAIGLAALYIRRESPGAVMIVLPADHAVKDEERLRSTYRAAIKVALERDALVTLGIKPESAHTGYGYIKRGEPLDGEAYEVEGFYEKPSLERAQSYFRSPDFFWNSGMFIWRAEVILAAIAKHMPSLHQGLARIEAALGTPDEQGEIAEVFSSLESTSIDFGVLEHAQNCVVIACEPFGWSDIGSWDVWAEHFPADQAGNTVLGEGLLIDAHGCVVHSEHKLTAVLGVDNLMVIETEDALLVCPRDQAQEVKKIVEMLKAKGREDLI
ncbi:MAG: NTP transferase domain-containing protein [Deltaproteobacteria bacterium]|nr:NTP transferase domain-containing protein [Deltaproteobacteria bacterium]